MDNGAPLVTVLGIPLDQLDRNAVRGVKTVVRMACMIVLIEWCGFIITCVYASENSARGMGSVFTNFVSATLFGCAVPWCGWRGATRRNANLLQSFCIGEAAVAFCGTLGVIIAIASAAAYRDACDSAFCQNVFVNSTSTDPQCTTQVGSGVMSNREVSLSKSYCDEVGKHWYYWLNLILLIVSALLGLAASLKTRTLRSEMLRPHIRTRVPANANIVAVEATVVDINQHCDTPTHSGQGVVAVSSMELVARAAPPLPDHIPMASAVKPMPDRSQGASKI